MQDSFEVIGRIERLARRDLGWTGGLIAPFLMLWRILSQRLGSTQGTAGFDTFFQGNMQAHLPGVLLKFEQAHPELTLGVFREVFADNADLEHDKGRDWARVCRQLQAHVSLEMFAMRNAAQDYAHIVTRLLSRTNPGGHQGTPYPLGTMAARILDPGDGQSVMDLGCGSGMALLACLEHRPDLNALGMEVDPELAGLAKCSLLLFGHNTARIVAGDMISHPLQSQGALARYEHVFCHPPVGYTPYGMDDLRMDLHGRFDEDLIDRGYLELLFTAHVLHVMRPRTGKAALILPLGFLGSESGLKLRKHFVQNNILDAVMVLPRTLYAMRYTKMVMVVLDNNRMHEEVLLFDAGKENDNAEQGGQQLAEQMVQDHRKRRTGHISNWARLITPEAIRSLNYNLKPLAYSGNAQAIDWSQDDLIALEKHYTEKKEASALADKALQTALRNLARLTG